MPLETTDQTGSYDPCLGGRGVIGSGRRDLESLINLNAEQFCILYPPVDVHERVQDGAQDDLYQEDVRPTFKDPIAIPTFFTINPQKKLLKSFGIEEEQEAIAVWSNRLLNTSGLDPVTGDRVEYLGILFDVITVKFDAYHLSTQVPLNKVATLRQVASR